jgi:5-formyltetrahydrofolate cyclo-ligase
MSSQPQLTSSAPEPSPALPPRPELRRRLLAQRSTFAESPGATAAAQALSQHLLTLVTTLEPQCLGLYWPVRSEFNASQMFRHHASRNTMRLALPFVHKSPPRMEYRLWDGQAPSVRDEVGIPSVATAHALPDVVLVPCLGFTDDAYRLGYGGGYFDRWLAANPQVVAVGIAWELGRLERGEFEVHKHDVALSMVVTERGVI